MKVVIEIPEEVKQAFDNADDINFSYYDYNSVIGKAIRNGTPLPKGHGRLIDADALKMDKRVCGDRYLSGSPLFVANKVIEQAPTIIEADRSEE